MAVIVKSRRGRDVVLLNPSEKGNKYASELRDGIHKTNMHLPKTTRTGEIIGLSNTEKAWRSGYLAAQKDSAKAYKAKKARRRKK